MPSGSASCRVSRRDRHAPAPRQAREALGEERLPVIRLHDLRHTHASGTSTLTVHQHVHPGMGREAADRIGALLEG